MYKYEDLYFKISDDFHSEINEILEKIEPTSKQDFWFNKPSISGKFFTINNVLLSLNSDGSNLYLLNRLKDVLIFHKSRLEYYYANNNLATGFWFLSAENIKDVEQFFSSFSDREEFCSRDEQGISLAKDEQNFFSVKYLPLGYLYSIGIDIIGFPNDCTLKLTAKYQDEEIIFSKQHNILFPVEKENGKSISNTGRTRNEHDNIEAEFWKKYGRFSQKSHEIVFDSFKKFAYKKDKDIRLLFESFTDCIKLCNDLLQKHQNDKTPSNLPEIEKIYSILKNDYIDASHDEFQKIFQPNYSGNKITWLKSGAQLKYFVDRLSEKFDLPNSINIWTENRFVFYFKNKEVKPLSRYLNKQKTKNEYQLLLYGNLKSNPLFKLFRG